jgi:hypothetical protein
MQNITTLNNVIVYGSPFPWITTIDGEIIDLPKNLQYYRNIYKDRKKNEIPNFKSLDVSNLEIVEEECCFMIGKYHIYPYGHLYDVIQYCKDYHNAGLINLPWLVGRTDTGHTQNLLENHFKVFGCQSTVYLKKDDIKIFKTLHVSHHETFPAQFDPEKIKWIRNKYFNHFETKINDFKKTLPEKYNLYLHRPSKRKVLNFEQIKPLLRKNNFIILDGSEGLIAHMTYFQNPGIVLGPHGSLFRNALFTDNSSSPKYYEFCPDNRIDKSIMGACLSCGGLSYEHILTPANDSHEITISVTDIKTRLSN